jgi:hypothetical protein
MKSLPASPGGRQMKRRRIQIWCLLLGIVPALVFAQSGRTRRRGSSGQDISGASPEVNIHGSLRSISRKDIVIDTGDDRILTFKRTRKTRFFKGTKEIRTEDFPDNAQVSVEAVRAVNGDLEAVSVYWGDPPKS